MSSPFASKSQSEPIALPFDEGQSIVVRKLTGREVEYAECEALKRFVSGKDSRGFSASIARVFAGVGSDSDVEKAQRDPMKGFDRIAIIRGGLVSWTYDMSIKPHMVTDIPVNGDTPAVTHAYDPIEDLDDEALEFIANAIWKLTKPWLYQTPEEAEAARKNG